MFTQSNRLAPDYRNVDTTLIDADTYADVNIHNKIYNKIKNNIIVINSVDRNWYNYPLETPYNFLVKLGGTSKDKYSIVSHNYKNIISFSIEKIILSNRVSNNSYISTLTPRLNDNPYITVIAKGINFSSYGTNKILNETIGIYTPLMPSAITSSDISYLEFKNSSVQTKEYYPAPESYISQLDLSITTPNGVLASNLNDVLEIYSIFLNTSNLSISPITNTLIIQTKTFFSANEFRINDLIHINNYTYHNMSFDESGIFNNWINTSSSRGNANGHYIIGIDKSNSTTTLYNQIMIPIPASLSILTGNIVVEPWFIDFDTKSLSNIAIEVASGKLININTQSHLIVNIKTIEKTVTQF